MVVRVHTIRFGFDKTSIVTFGATSFTLEGSIPDLYWSSDTKGVVLVFTYRDFISKSV